MDSGCNGEDFGLSWGGVRAFVERILSFRGGDLAFPGFGLSWKGILREEDIGLGLGASWGRIRTFVGRILIVGAEA